jgi:hypothetical protein
MQAARTSTACAVNLLAASVTEASGSEETASVSRGRVWHATDCV